MLVISIQIGIDSAEWMLLWDVWGRSSKHGLNALKLLDFKLEPALIYLIYISKPQPSYETQTE